MLTPKDTLKWVTRRPGPPWRIGELRSALKANPTKVFSLKQAITAVEKETCVISVGVRDSAVVHSSATWAELKANWNSSAPSRGTLTSVITMLGAKGAFLKNLSKNWQTAAIVSPLPNLKAIEGVVITEANFQDFPSVGSIVGAVGKMKLPRFRGHRTIWVRGVHDGQDKSSLPA
jgi:hypothetical protein